MAFLPDTHQPSQAEIQALIKLLNAGQREKGEAVARRLVKNFPNGHMGHFLLAVALTGQRKWAPAIHSYRNALALKPDDIDTLNNMGVVFRQAGKLGEAADCYLKAQRLQPTNPDILYNLAGLFEAQGKTDDAINMYLRVVALMPRHIDALNNLAVI